MTMMKIGFKAKIYVDADDFNDAEYKANEKIGKIKELDGWELTSCKIKL